MLGRTVLLPRKDGRGFKHGEIVSVRRAGNTEVQVQYVAFALDKKEIMAAKIVILDGFTVNPGDNPWTPIESLGDITVHERSAADEVCPRAADAEIVVVNKIRMDTDVFRQLPKLKLVAVTATGYDCVDLSAAQSANVSVCNVPVYSTESVAQFVFSLLLHLVHNVSIHDQLIREGEWQRCGDFSFWRTQLIELHGRTLGIVGWGRIGQRVGKLADAFGMRVLACSRRSHDAPEFDGFGWRSLDELAGESDFLSLHCPLTESTEGMIHAERLARMRDSAFLLNTARGGLVVEQDLADALRSRGLAGAALDVSATEPISPESPLLTAPNCILTPHIAWATKAARQRCLAITADNIANFLSGNPSNLVS